jgi:hypothetical protein
MELHQASKLLHSTGNKYQGEDIAYRMGEKSLPAIHLTGLICRLHKELKKIKHQKNK